MNEDEPPSSNSLASPLFLIGRDSHGHWVAQHQRGLCGGLFVDRAEALKFAISEMATAPRPSSWFRACSN